MSTPDNICSNSASKSNDDVCEINDKLQNKKTADVEDNVSIVCANCGKGEDGTHSLKACTACKMVKYCNRECQIAHRPQHKKACKKRAAELHDEKLFKLPLQYDDCPICFLRMPLIDSGHKYMSCCGKVICSGCIHAPRYDDQGNKVNNKSCPFCRAPTPKFDDEIVERLITRVEAGDTIAMNNLGLYHDEGSCGISQNHAKALELWHRAGELGSAEAYHNIGSAYRNGCGVKMDMKKAKYYTELAAMAGDTYSRHNLGVMEEHAGNIDRAIKHFMIATVGGTARSLNDIQNFYMQGRATKEDYTKALRLYQEYLNEVKSIQRDEAAAFGDKYKYIE